MNICWEILGIEPTTDLECIRQAYLALLPSFHPESDPQGFKRLRQAYEEALHWPPRLRRTQKRKRWATNMKYWWRSGNCWHQSAIAFSPRHGRNLFSN